MFSKRDMKQEILFKFICLVYILDSLHSDQHDVLLTKSYRVTGKGVIRSQDSTSCVPWASHLISLGSSFYS